MKLFFLTIIQILFISQLLGQTFFEAEGKQIKTGTISKSYNFAYSFGDSLKLIFVDSGMQYSNAEKSIIKTITYPGYSKNSEPSINIKYFGFNRRDSIEKYFIEGKPSRTYKTNYDSIGRIIYHCAIDFNADSTYNRDFEYYYEYRDSLISTGKIEIQTIFVKDAAGDKRFRYRVLNEYDNKARKIKEVGESEVNDPRPLITIYTYNDKDSLISAKQIGMETLPINEKHINTKCDIENEYSFIATDYKSIKHLIFQLLIANKKLLKEDKCENYFLTLLSFNKQTRLKIVKRKPYSCDGRRVFFTTTTQL